MIYLKVKDGNEEKAKFYIGGAPEMIYVQSISMITSISDLFVENYDTQTAENYVKELISDLKDYYSEKFLKEYNGK